MYAASAMAANTVARSACGAAAPLFTNQMFGALGIGGGASLVGGVAGLLAIIPFLFYKFGARIRKRSRFAPDPDAGNNNEKEKEGEKDENQDDSRSSLSRRSGSSDSTVSFSEDASTHAEEHERRKESHSDIHQSAMGEPRTANTRFGREDV